MDSRGDTGSGGLLPAWLDAAFIVVGLGFAIGSTSLWRQIAGCLFAAICLADLAGYAVRHWRRRR